MSSDADKGGYWAPWWGGRPVYGSQRHFWILVLVWSIVGVAVIFGTFIGRWYLAIPLGLLLLYLIFRFVLLLRSPRVTNNG